MAHKARCQRAATTPLPDYLTCQERSGAHRQAACSVWAVGQLDVVLVLDWLL